MNVTKHKITKNVTKNKTVKRINKNKNLLQSLQISRNLLKANDIDSNKKFLNSLHNAIKPSHIKLKNDFYSYINDKWLKETHVNEEQKYIYQVDDFRLVQDKVYRELLDIVKEYTTNPKTKNTKKAICLKNVYNSMNKLNTNEQSMNYAKLALEQIDKLMKNKSNLWKLLAMINKNEIISGIAPFVWFLLPDDKNPNTYICHIDPPQMPIVVVDVYFDDGKNIEYKKMFKKKFFDYLQVIFDSAFGKNNGFNVIDVFNCQKKMLYAMGCDKLHKQTNEMGYNLVTKETAKKTYLFDWDEFGKELGFKHTPDVFVTSNLNYLLCGTKLFIEEWNTPEWRTYWVYLYIRQQQRFNLKGFYDFYEFHGKFLRGQEKPMNKDMAPIFIMSFTFNTFLTREYIKKYNNKESIDYVTLLANDLKITFMQILMRNKWLDPKTKKIAIKKINNIKFIVGYHPYKILTVDPLLNYTEDDIWGNMTKMAEWRHYKFLESVGNSIIHIPFIDWLNIPPKFMGQQVYTVNAMYYNRNNKIYIPLAYIQSPFLDLNNRGIEYNLAFMGFTIAHEMSHALDDLGHLYDENGILNNWWTPKDKEYFKRLQESIVKQYEFFAKRDGIKYDASISVGEDIADISGLNICTEYLRNYQEQNKDILPIKLVSFEAFFIYFAIQHKEQVKKKSLNAQLKINPHPLDKYRTNISLSRNPIFRIIFDIKKENKMWWNSTNRIWEE